MGVDPVSALDRLVGDAIETANHSHHRRRLRRLGHGASVEPPDDGMIWAAGDPPPREGNEVELLVDRAEMLPEAAAAIQGAKRSGHGTGRPGTARLAPPRPGAPPLGR